jgi:dTMP kinase
MEDKNMEKGKVIVIDGMPGAGKRTNTKNVCLRLAKEGIFNRQISFPNSFSDSSTLIKRYLRGHFLNNFGEENTLTYIKQMSMFFAVDRIAAMVKNDLSFHLSNLELLNKGCNLICDRYVTSNMLHMSTYLNNFDDMQTYIDWIDKIEYDELGIPRPDLVLFLDVDREISLRNITRKYNTNPDKEQFDIHKTTQHLDKVIAIKDDIISYCGWRRITCTNSSGEMKPLDEINEQIYKEIKRALQY